MNRIEDDTLELIGFTTEIIDSKLSQLSQIEVERDNTLKTEQQESLLSKVHDVCTELGDLALSVPINQITAEADAIEGSKNTTVDEHIASVLDFAARIGELIPWLRVPITTAAQQQAPLIRLDGSNRELDQDDQDRVDALRNIESVFDKPVKSDAAVGMLLEYFASHTQEVVRLQEHAPLPYKELLRQLTKQTSKERFIEYFSASVGHTVREVDLVNAACAIDGRNILDKNNVFNPRQSLGISLAKILAEQSLVIQRGWLKREGSERPERIVRSLSGAAYCMDHVGSFIFGKDAYEWEEVDESALLKIRGWTS